MIRITSWITPPGSMLGAWASNSTRTSCGPAQGANVRRGMLTAGDLVLNTTFRYEAILPDEKPFRVCDIHQPVCPDFDPQVHRDVGDIVEAETRRHCGAAARTDPYATVYLYAQVSGSVQW